MLLERCRKGWRRPTPALRLPFAAAWGLAALSLLLALAGAGGAAPTCTRSPPGPPLQPVSRRPARRSVPGLPVLPHGAATGGSCQQQQQVPCLQAWHATLRSRSNAAPAPTLVLQAQLTPDQLLELAAPAVRYLRAFTTQCWLPVRNHCRRDISSSTACHDVSKGRNPVLAHPMACVAADAVLSAWVPNRSWPPADPWPAAAPILILAPALLCLRARAPVAGHPRGSHHAACAPNPRCPTSRRSMGPNHAYRCWPLLCSAGPDCAHRHVR